MQAALVEEALVGCGLWQPSVVKRAFSRRAGLAQDVRMEQGEEHTSGGVCREEDSCGRLVTCQGLI